MQTIDKQTRDAWHAHDADLHAWMRANNRNSYRPEELPAQLLPTLTNEQLASIEMFDWINDPPKRYFAYVKSDRGGITGSHITSLTYSGTAYIDAGDYVRMRAIKG